VKSVSWSHSGQLLATCSRDKSVWLWEVSDDDEYECAAVLNAHSQDVKKVVWHPHADLLASASYDNTVKLFREDQMEQDWCCVATLSGHQSTVWSLAFDRTGKFSWKKSLQKEPNLPRRNFSCVIIIVFKNYLSLKACKVNIVSFFIEPLKALIFKRRVCPYFC